MTKTIKVTNSFKRDLKRVKKQKKHGRTKENNLLFRRGKSHTI